MQAFKRNIFVLTVVIFLSVATVYTSPLYGSRDYNGEFQTEPINDLEAYLQLQPSPSKRGWCRSGFSYSPVLRRCQPSISILRGRSGRIGRRGIRGIGF